MLPSRIRLDLWVRFSYRHGWLGLHIWWRIIWVHLIFRPITIWFHTGTYFLFGWDLWISIDLYDHPHLRDTCWVNDLLLFCHDSPMGSFLSHSVRFILSDIVVILWWSYLRCIKSHIIISVEYMSNLLYISMGLFLSHRNRLDALVAILGHISLFLTWRGFFSHIPYSLHYLTEGYLFALLDAISMIFAEMSSQRSTTFGFWLPHYPWLFSRLVCWDRGSYPSGLFSWDSPIDHSFEMTMASSSRAFRVRGVRLIVTLRQTSWFSQILWDYIYSRFNLSNSLTEHLLRLRESLSNPSMDWELWRHATLGHIFPSSYPCIFSLVFKATMSSQLRCLESSLSAWHS